MQRAFTLIELMIVIAIIAIIAAIAIPNLLEARKSGNEAAAIGSLKAISTAQTIYKNQLKDSNGNFATLTELGSAELVDAVLASRVKQGYEFNALPSQNVGMRPYVWFARAVPVVLGNTGDRTFMTNHFGVIAFTTDTSGISFNFVDCTFAGAQAIGK